MLHFETIDLNTLELLRKIQSHAAFSGISSTWHSFWNDFH